MPSRNVAIRDAGPQIGFDIMTLGVPADSAGVRHATAQRPNAAQSSAVSGILFTLRWRPAQQPENFDS